MVALCQALISNDDKSISQSPLCPRQADQAWPTHGQPSGEGIVCGFATRRATTPKHACAHRCPRVRAWHRLTSLVYSARKHK